MIEILYKSKNAVVIYKPAGIPSQPDLTGDKDALTLTQQRLSELGEDRSLWLIHRLDRGVGGLMIFARNKTSSAELSEIVRDRQIVKEYLAVVEGVADGGVMEDYLFKDTRTSKAYVTDRPRAGVKAASLEYRTLATLPTERGMRSLVYVTLNTGRFHQIRAQFASRKMPLVGDKKYGSKDCDTRSIALHAAHLSIACRNERIELTRMPDITKYPWSLFTSELSGDL